METIKFRIYNSEEKKMVVSGATPMMLSSFFENTATLDTVYKMKYQQFTGLLDKNGKEIFEGDIVKVSDNCDASWGEIHEVVWLGENGYPAFDLDNWDGEANGLSEVDNDYEFEMEIIGNIYENPTLLSEPK